MGAEASSSSGHLRSRYKGNWAGKRQKKTCACVTWSPEALGETEAEDEDQEVSPTFSCDSHSRRLLAPGLSPGKLTGTASGQSRCQLSPRRPGPAEVTDRPPNASAVALPGS